MKTDQWKTHQLSLMPYQQNVAQMQQNHNCDVEKGEYQPEYLEGYPSLAAFIASDKELAVYRGFDRLSARNILYAQSELLYLEEKLDAFDKEDLGAELGNLERASARSWDILQKKSNKHDEERFQCVMQLRTAMKDYREHTHINEKRDNQKRSCN
jgi:hypothetical protein